MTRTSTPRQGERSRRRGRRDEDGLVDAALHGSGIYGPHQDPGELREMKVVVPLEMHIKLHGLKILQGQSISTSVNTALERYFDRLSGRRPDSTD